MPDCLHIFLYKKLRNENEAHNEWNYKRDKEEEEMKEKETKTINFLILNV